MIDNAEFSAFAVKINSRQMTTQFIKKVKHQQSGVRFQLTLIDNDVFDTVV